MKNILTIKVYYYIVLLSTQINLEKHYYFLRVCVKLIDVYDIEESKLEEQICI